MRGCSLLLVLTLSSCTAVQDWWSQKAGPAICQTVGPIQNGGSALASFVLPPVASGIVSTAWVGLWDMMCGAVEVAGTVITDPVGTVISPVEVVVEAFSEEGESEAAAGTPDGSGGS